MQDAPGRSGSPVNIIAQSINYMIVSYHCTILNTLPWIFIFYVEVWTREQETV